MPLLFRLALACAPAPEDKASEPDTADTGTGDTSPSDTDTSDGDTSNGDTSSTDSAGPDTGLSYAASDQADAIVVGSSEAPTFGGMLSASLAGDGAWLATMSSVVALPESGVHRLGDERVAWFESDQIVAVGDLDGDGVDDVIGREWDYHQEQRGDTWAYFSRTIVHAYLGPIAGSTATSASLLAIETPFSEDQYSHSTLEPWEAGTTVVVSAPAEGSTVIETRAITLATPSWADGALLASGYETTHDASIADLAGDGERRLPIRTRSALALYAESSLGAPEVELDIGEYVYAAQTAGDIDGDGYADLLVSVAEAALVFAGPVPDGAAAIVRISSDTQDDGYGNVAWHGGADADGDGHDDIAMGDASETGAGAVHVLFGPLSGVVAVADAGWHANGDAPGDNLGSNVALSAGGTLLAGAPGAQFGGDIHGSVVYVLSPTP